MATKTITTKPSAEEIKYLRKVKSVELAIKSTVGKNGASIGTVIKSAKDIYEYINE